MQKVYSVYNINMGNSNTTDQIKEKLDIVDFLKGYVTLIPSGKNFKAVCPFHKEKTPSFMVSPERQTWHCFGACNTGGDIFAFLMRYENIEFFEALKMLAEKTNIELRKIDPGVARQFGVLFEIHQSAKNYFVSLLAQNNTAMNYALGRGLASKTIDEFEIGLSPTAKDALTVFLINQKFQVDDILRSGLAIRSDRGGFYDRFRGRLMFPLYDHFGKVVGFTGRILPEYDDKQTAKYINSPETPIFKKSKLFYGFDKAKSEIRETKTAFLVEGQMDCLLSRQDGIKNVLATSGTALTEDHLTFLKRQADKLILCFDADEAGVNAIERAIDMAGAYEFEVSVVNLPEGLKDPADCVVQKPGELERVIKAATSAMEFYFKRYIKDDKSKNNIQIILKKISFLKSAIDKSRELKSLSERIGVSELDLREEYERIKNLNVSEDKVEAPLSSFNNSESNSINKDRRSLLAESLLRVAIMKNDTKIAEDAKEYLPPYYKEMLNAILNGKTTKELQNAIDLIALQPDTLLAHNQDDLIRELKLDYLISEKNKLASDIKRYELSGPQDELLETIKKLDLLSKQIHNLKN